MAWNPAIGGTAKGHLVREIDAPGGEMGVAADATCIQFRMRQYRQRAAVHSLRGQADKKEYQKHMRRALESEPNLDILQAEACDIVCEDGAIRAVTTTTGARYDTKSVVVATGVYLNSRTIVGDYVRSSGPSGLFPATHLSASIAALGIPLMRFKTGTPPRLDARSIDFSKTSVQDGDTPAVPFSFLTDEIDIEQIPCHLTSTNERTHKILRDNMHRSPLYSGIIEGTGTRYCPSIEDKVVKFPGRDRHPIFLEPEGRDGIEIYVQGMSSSMPEQVQFDALHTIESLENCRIMRTAYAIEYDCIRAEVLDHALCCKDIPGLYFAGQVNGTSGYEEAAAQGIVAGAQRCTVGQGRKTVHPRSRRRVHRRSRGRSCDKADAGAVSHDDVPCGIPSDPAAGQRRHASDGKIARNRTCVGRTHGTPREKTRPVVAGAQRAFPRAHPLERHL